MSTFLVTSVARGIGKAVTDLLLQLGHTVYGISRYEFNINQENLESQAFFFNKVESYDFKSLEQLFMVYKRNGVLFDGILVVSGGVREIGAFVELGPAEWRNAYEDNVFPSLFLAQLMISHADLFSPKVEFVSLGSKVASNPGFFNPHYAAAKGALRTLILFLQKHHRYKKYNFSLLEFGTVDSAGYRENVAKFNQKFGQSLHSKDTEESKKPLTSVTELANKICQHLLGIVQIDYPLKDID